MTAEWMGRWLNERKMKRWEGKGSPLPICIYPLVGARGGKKEDNGQSCYHTLLAISEHAIWNWEAVLASGSEMPVHHDNSLMPAQHPTPVQIRPWILSLWSAKGIQKVLFFATNIEVTWYLVYCHLSWLVSFEASSCVINFCPCPLSHWKSHIMHLTNRK